MEDIVARLREFHKEPLPDDMQHYIDAVNALHWKAADEIERLRAAAEEGVPVRGQRT